MFGFLKKNKEQMIASPVNGEVVPITEVSDETFSSGMLGDGFGVIPQDGKICAPADGKVTLIFDTKHALSIVTEWGAEILVHIGLETVTLEGEPFTVCVEKDQDVKKGDLLVETNLDAIKQAGLNTTVITVICNSSDYASTQLKEKGERKAGTDVMAVQL